MGQMIVKKIIVSIEVAISIRLLQNLQYIRYSKIVKFNIKHKYEPCGSHSSTMTFLQNVVYSLKVVTKIEIHLGIVKLHILSK